MMFTFLVITYNHENYILQNLESIKYQINNFGQYYEFQLIVADDASNDKTVELVKYWIGENKELFKYTDIASNHINQGTCKNYIKGIRLIKGDYIKFIAGDDIFSTGNIFNLLQYLKEYDLIMGIPISFSNGIIDNSLVIKETVYHISMELYFEKEIFNKRIRRSSFLHTPSAIFKKELIQNENIIEFIQEFNIIEDYSTWLKMAEEKPNLRYKFIPEFVVLYRRTEGSAYIVKKNDYHNDRVKLFEYIIKTEKNIFNKIIQYNSLFCFKSNSIRVKKYFNYLNYTNKIAQLLSRRNTNKIFKSLESDIELNKRYLKIIVESARKISSNYLRSAP